MAAKFDNFIHSACAYIGVLALASAAGAACGNSASTGGDSQSADAGMDTGTDAGGTDAGSTDAGSTDAGTVATNGVLCDLNASGDQRLVYTHSDPPTGQHEDVDETLTYEYAWSCADGERVLSGNGVPNHATTGGDFATKVSTQNISYSVTLNPARTGQTTDAKVPGYALNSVKFDPGTAGTCPNDATSDHDCDYARGSDDWHMVALPGQVSPWKFSFGVDESHAHVQPNGQYHYHGNPVDLVKKLNPDYQHSMTLVGWAADGFPIYSVYGHSDPEDPSSGLAEMHSSYQLITDVPANRPSVDDFPLGHFESDWRYVAGSGDLDECNGRFGVTPEFPQGIYHYFITKTYPYVQRCVKGTATDTGEQGPPPGPPPGM